VSVDGARARWSRTSLFDDAPSGAHLSAGTALALEVGPGREVELTRYTTANRRRFAPSLYAPGDVREEPRGRGQVGGACHRLVRTIFDRTNADPEADLVLGEVVTLPGRWSSYPPHHHAQPELYHYRFDRPEGYGHAEHGEEIFKVRHGDTVLITPPNDHAQAAAPGYAMYYAWAIRHLPGRPYDAPTFDDAHRWVMEPDAPAWSPRPGPPWDLESR
jgi:5-deoxy-glucuronate isomerase